MVSVPLYLTSIIDFATTGFFPKVGFGKRLFFFGQPGALIGDFPASSKVSATRFVN